MSNFNEELAGKLYDVFNNLTRRTLDQKEVEMLHRNSWTSRHDSARAL
jgi:hypothetical protein